MKKTWGGLNETYGCKIKDKKKKDKNKKKKNNKK